MLIININAYRYHINVSCPVTSSNIGRCTVFHWDNVAILERFMYQHYDDKISQYWPKNTSRDKMLDVTLSHLSVCQNQYVHFEIILLRTTR